MFKIYPENKSINIYLNKTIVKKIQYLCFSVFFIATLLGCNKTSNPTVNNNDSDIPFVENSESDFLEYNIDEVAPMSNQNLWIKFDNSLSETETIYRLIDAYNSSVVMNSMFSDYEIVLLGNSECENEEVAMKNIKFEQYIKDAETLSKLNKYKQDLNNFLIVDIETLDPEVHSPWKSKDDLFEYLSQKYNLNTFGNLTPEIYTENYFNCPSVPEYKELITKRGDKNIVAELREKYENAKDFNARCIYAIELAHAYDVDKSTWIDINPAIPIMESLMNEKQFSIYLYELWLKWRVLRQDLYGSSKYSDIPNNIYNEYRKICLETILSYIDKYPTDIMAINEFIVLSFADNIFRIGAYQYGNQYVVEKDNLFYIYYDEYEEY